MSIVLFVFASIAALGYSLRHELAKETAGVSIIIDLPEDVAWRTLILISVSASIMVLSAGVCLSLFRGGRARPTAITWQARPANIWVLLASAVPLAMFLSDVPLADFFERSYYLVGARGGIVASLGAQLAVVAVVVLGYVAATGSLGLKLGSYPLLACYVMLMLSFGSRRFALLPVLFALGFFLARNTAGTRRGLLLGGVLSLLLLPLPLEFRSNSMHGIIPYVATLSHLDWEDIDWFGAVNNVLVSFPIIGESAYGGHPVYLSDLLVALNPLPGDAAGFYDSYQRLRLNFFTPMAGIGELGAIGWTAVAPFFAGLGAALAWIELSVRRQLVGGSLIYGGLLIALTALFSLQMVQYNLRSAVRLLFYAIVIEIVRRMLAVVVRKRQGSAVPRGGRVRPVADRA
ncbi:hypothetical protein [Microbacterium sp. SORGH_AS_0862]|uniref:hypothetical protein n=1 Tax=Microbacterium sp. SORGH_AS_0862 TaxID=3041789 RepID=UPI0027D84966|nr:hypothetical protein [Microbacterium sp. SORGH_AS_0862]